jgi:hypothetical protein
MTKIQEAALGLLEKHGSWRKAAKAVGMHYSLLHKIGSGTQCNPTVKTLQKLGMHIEGRRKA